MRTLTIVALGGLLALVSGLILTGPPRVLPDQGTSITESEKPGLIELHYEENQIELYLWGNWKQEALPEKAEAGVKSFQCKVDGRTDTQKGVFLDHEVKKIVFECPIRKQQPVTIQVLFKNRERMKLNYSQLFVTKH